MKPVESAGERVLGILATPGVRRPPTPSDPIPGRTRTFRDLARIGRANGLQVAVFSPRHVDRKRKVVQAYLHTPGIGWVRKTIPLPRVVYNRVANRRAENRPRTQQVLTWLKSEGVAVFNPAFLDKWEVYACLQEDPELSRHVPETVLYTHPEQVAEMLRRWGSVFCKPRRGSLGTGITGLRLTPTGGVTLAHNGVQVGTRVQHLANVGAAVRWARQRLIQRRVCLQRGIDLAKARGRRFDIRALVQKDETGQWRFTGAAARLAAQGQLTTHVPRGGARLSLTKALQSALHDKAAVERVRQELEALTVAAAHCLERALGDEYGEFSLDIGMDRKGQLWIFEMNAKPFRFDEADIRQKAFRRLIGYSRYLVDHISN